MTKTSEGWQKWRRLARWFHALAIIGIPFVQIDGNSLLRLDIPSLRLMLLGRPIPMEDFFFILLATFFFVIFIFFITVLFGRVWCGWMCPQTIGIDFTRFVDYLHKSPMTAKLGAYGAVALMSVLMGANLIWYFVSPYEFFDRLLQGELGTVLWGFWISLSLLAFLNYAFLRHHFCTVACPYAKFQGVVFDERTLVIAYDPARDDDCIRCEACVRTCPVGIDIRKGLQSACISCAECIDACTDVMKRFDKPSIINYYFGTGQTQRSIARPSVIILGLASALLLLATLWVLQAREAYSVLVQPNYMFKPRVREELALNAYLLKVKNKASEPIVIEFSAAGVPGIRLEGTTSIRMEPGQTDEASVFVAVPVRHYSGERLRMIAIESRVQLGDESEEQRYEVNFRYPQELNNN